MTRSLLMLLAGTGVGLILSAGTAQAESLREAVAAALANHPSVDVARAGETYSSEERREHISDLFPQVSATATGGRMYGDNSTSRGLTANRGQAYSWLWEGNATLTQPLFNGFETYNRIDAARARQSSAQFKVADAQETLALRAVQAYITVLQTTEAVQKIKAYRAKIGDYQGRIQTMVDEGVADEAEVAQAKNVSLLLDNTLAETQSQLETAYAAYREAVGKLPESALERPDAPDNVIPASADEAFGFAQNNHPVMLALQKEMEAAEYEVDAERGTLMPALDGELSYLKRDQKEEIGGEVEDGRALLRMSWDFATGGGDLARIRKMKAAYSEKLAQSQQSLREIERDISIAFADLARAEKQKALSAERAQIMQDLFDANETQFEGARVRLLQLMQSDNQLFGAQLEKMNADYSHLLAQYAVLASTGKLQAALMGETMPTAVPVVDGPKAIETKVEPVPAPDVEPVPEIKQIDEKAVHQGLLKEPAPQKAVTIEPEDAADAADTANEAEAAEAREKAVQEKKAQAEKQTVEEPVNPTPVFDRVKEEAVPEPLPPVDPVSEPVLQAPATKAAPTQAEMIAPVEEKNVEPVVQPPAEAEGTAPAEETQPRPDPVVIEDERVYPDLDE